MRIYYISAVDLSNYDAQRTHVLEVVSEMKKFSVDVTLFTPLFSKTRERFNFNHFFLPVFFKNSKIKFFEYEISLFIFLLWHVLKKRPDIIYIRKGFLTILPTLISKTLKIKSILEVNGFIPDEIKLSFNVPQFVLNIFTSLEKFNLQIADKIITVTEGIKNLLHDSYNIEPEKIMVIPNGVNISKFYPKEKSNNNVYHLGFVGNLVNWSGLEYLVRSLPAILNKIKNIKCLIVGDGVQKKYLQQIADELDIKENLKITGFVSPEEIPNYINQCDICYLPAVKQRNARIGISPIKLYEYLACGVPVIVTNIEGMTFVKEQNVGIVVEPENSEALAKATLNLLQDSELRKKMSNIAHSFIENNYTWKITTQKILNLCNKLN